MRYKEAVFLEENNWGYGGGGISKPGYLRFRNEGIEVLIEDEDR